MKERWKREIYGEMEGVGDQDGSPRGWASGMWLAGLGSGWPHLFIT